MKSKAALLSLVSFIFSFAVVAQEIENDDMYFNSKDRAKLKASKGTEISYTASIKKNKKETVQEEEPVNPTDSYSARNVNPEYEARTNAETAQADNEDYFVNNYRYNNATNFNNWNNNFSNWYNNPWYGGNYYDPYINSWNSPYYGSYYDSWGNPWRNPYYRSGWSSSFSYHWGSSWNYGWGMNFGYMNPYYNSWAWSPYYGYSPWGSYYGWGGYPSQVVIIESGYRNAPVYGKRSSRSSELSRDYSSGSTRSNNRGLVDSNTGGRTTTGGRVSTTTSSRTQTEYYNRGWRNQTQSSYSNPSYNSGNSSYSNPNSNSGNSRSSWESNTRSSWSNGSSNSGGSSYSGGRSSGGGSSSGSSGGGSSSGSRSSGRGH